jgi:hypothetical protein
MNGVLRDILLSHFLSHEYAGYLRTWSFEELVALAAFAQV